MSLCLACDLGPPRQAGRVGYCRTGLKMAWIDRKIRGGKMHDLTENEIAAMDTAAARLGEFLDSLGKTDLARLSEGEFMTAVECCVGGFFEQLKKTDECPF